MIHTDPPFLRKRKKPTKFFPGMQEGIDQSRERIDRISQETDYLNAAGVGAEPPQDSAAQKILRAVMAGLGNVDQRQGGFAGFLGSVGAGYNSAQGAIDRQTGLEWDQSQETARNAADIYNQNQRTRTLEGADTRRDALNQSTIGLNEARTRYWDSQANQPPAPPRQPAMTPYDRLESTNRWYNENEGFTNPLMNPKGGRGAGGGLDAGKRWILDAAQRWLNSDAGYGKTNEEAIGIATALYDSVVGGGDQPPDTGGLQENGPFRGRYRGGTDFGGSNLNPFGGQPGQGNGQQQTNPDPGMTPQLQGYVGGARNPLARTDSVPTAPNAGGSRALTQPPSDAPFDARGVSPYEVSDSNTEATQELLRDQVAWDAGAAEIKNDPGKYGESSPEEILGPRPTRP